MMPKRMNILSKLFSPAISNQQSVKMATYHLEIPIALKDKKTTLDLIEGGIVFIVGPNGAGKSALIQNFTLQIPEAKVRRISAHRQNWLENSAPDITPSRRLKVSGAIRGQNRIYSARYLEELSEQRLTTVLADLISRENHWARKLAEECSAKGQSPGKYREQNPSPVERVNYILQRGGLSIAIEISAREEILALHKNGARIGFVELSDGERNAVVLATHIVTADAGEILLIDEPERHLHRSIIEPLISAALLERQDCYFIVSTHEIALPVLIPSAQIIIVRSCKWGEEKRVEYWDVDILDAGSEIPDQLKEAILGSRRTILFIEGDARSLDISLYVLLFPNITLIPKETARNVLQSVAGLRGTSGLHEIRAFGLIDRDDRGDAEILALKEKGIFVLESSAVEAIYYCRPARTFVAARQAETLGKLPEDLLGEAENAALAELSKPSTIQHMVTRRSERLVREVILQNMPRAKDLTKSDLAINVSSPVGQEKSVYDTAIKEADLDFILNRYPIRETGALNAIVAGLRFRSRKDYEESLLALIASNENLKAAIFELLRPLSTTLQ